jgi:hypothetical protein
MIPSFGMMCIRRLGVPRKIIDLKLQVLRQIRLYPRSAHGISPAGYGNVGCLEANTPFPADHKHEVVFDDPTPSRLFGVSQGTQDAGAIFLAIWIVIYTALMTQIPGLQLSNPSNTITVKRKAEAFVDDTDLWVNATTINPTHTDGPVSPANILQGLTTLAQFWYRLLRASGGALGFHKCFWTGMFWTWTNGKARYMTENEFSDDLILETDTPDPVTVVITRIAPERGILNLGVLLAPNGSQTDELKVKMAKAKDAKHRIWHSPLSRNESAIAHDRVWWPSLSYSLGATTFSKKECAKLQSTFQASFLGKMGFNRRMPRCIRYGPKTLGGLSLKTVWVEQGLKHILLLLDHTRRNDDIGKHIRISLEITQLETGLEFPFYEAPWTDYAGYVEPTWMTHTWNFLSDTELQLKLPSPWIPEPQRQNDRFLMEILRTASSTTLRDSALRSINRCRLFLQVTTLSDITDGTGKYILEDVHKGSANGIRDRKSTYEFPRQAHPPRTDWMIFRRQLKLLLRDPLGNFDKTTLHDSYQLKEWLPNARRSQTFRHHFAPSTACLYTYHDNGRIYKSLARTRRQFHSHETLVPHLPPDAVPVTKTTTAAIAGFHGFATETEVPPPDPPQTMADLLADIPDWKQAYMRDLTTSIDIEKILLAALLKGTLIVVADGSAPSAGGFAWVLAAYEDPLHLIHGGGYTGPSPFGITSHRMEASGCLGGLFAIDLLIKTHHPEWTQTEIQQLPTIRFYSDNLETIQRIEAPARETDNDTLRHDYDLFAEVSTTRLALPRVAGLWVKGHQDDTTAFDDLPFEAQLNVKADDLAGTFRFQSPDDYIIPTPNVPRIFAGLYQLTGDIKPAIRDIATYDPLRTRLMQENEWTAAAYLDIDWLSHGRALKRLDRSRTTSTIKFLHSWLPTSQQQHEIDEEKDAHCQNCTEQHPETEDHILRCTNELVKQARDTAIKSLRTRLSHLETPTDLTNCILHGLTSWIALSPTLSEVSITCPAATPGPSENTQLHDAFQRQSLIGWGHLFRGRISIAWSQIVARHYRTNKMKSEYNADRWNQAIIKALWDIFDSQWTTRNQVIHGATLQDAQEKALARLTTDITSAFQFGRYELTRHDTKLLDTPCEIILKRSLIQQRAWLKSFHTARDAWRKIDDLRETNPIDRGPQQTLITDHFRIDRA